jgi:hypothetical protein
MTLDKNGNTLLHALACSKGLPAKQIGMLQDIVKIFFDRERDLEKRELFYNHKNTFGDTALNVAANANNKALVLKLMFLPGANTESKSLAHPKGLDFLALGIDYGTALARENAILFERQLALGERLDYQEKVITNQREAIRAAVSELEDARREIGMLADALVRSEQRQLMLMQMMGTLCDTLGIDQRLIAGPDLFRGLAAPFLALGDAAGAGAGGGEYDLDGADGYAPEGEE